MCWEKWDGRDRCGCSMDRSGWSRFWISCGDVAGLVGLEPARTGGDTAAVFSSTARDGAFFRNLTDRGHGMESDKRSGWSRRWGTGLYGCEFCKDVARGIRGKGGGSRSKSGRWRPRFCRRGRLERAEVAGVGSGRRKSLGPPFPAPQRGLFEEGFLKRVAEKNCDETREENRARQTAKEANCEASSAILVLGARG